jgi:hypothetical protein
VADLRKILIKLLGDFKVVEDLKECSFIKAVAQFFTHSNFLCIKTGNFQVGNISEKIVKWQTTIVFKICP